MIVKYGESFKTAYKVLDEIYRKRVFSDIALNTVGADGAVRRMVLGVLERDCELSYIIEQYVKEKPKPVVTVALKLGAYCLLYMDNVKDYAAVNETVAALKAAGKGANSSFVNAVLRNIALRKYSLPEESDSRFYSIKYNKPQWFVGLVFDEYSKQDAIRILSAKQTELTHFRVNSAITTKSKIESAFADADQPLQPSAVGGYFGKMSALMRDLFRLGLITYQGCSSMRAVQVAGISKADKVLDVCSAPGGKSVYAAEFAPEGRVVACDIHEHRLGLVRSYATRMKINNIDTVCADATVYTPRFEQAFDVVLVDAPCSGLGVVGEKPDILLNRSPSDIEELAVLQSSILTNSAQYVKAGGTLLYSTCTVASLENQNVVDRFLSQNKQFVLSPFDDCNGKMQILPDECFDGFYIAKLVRL